MPHSQPLVIQEDSWGLSDATSSSSSKVLPRCKPALTTRTGMPDRSNFPTAPAVTPPAVLVCNQVSSCPASHAKQTNNGSFPNSFNHKRNWQRQRQQKREKREGERHKTTHTHTKGKREIETETERGEQSERGRKQREIESELEKEREREMQAAGLGSGTSFP